MPFPAPEFIVFYNGTDQQPAQQTLRLSDAFLKKQKLMKDCRLLGEYAQYVDQVRKFAEEMLFEEAVEKAVDYCIKNGILADLLSKNREEVIAVSAPEYKEKTVRCRVEE